MPVNANDLQNLLPRRPRPVFKYGLLVLLALPLAFPASLAGLSRDRQPPKLFLGGGGVMGGLYKEFRELAGPDARLVVIPSATGEPDLAEHAKRWKSRGFEHITILHADDREAASSRQFAEPLKHATAVWISGGVQQHLADLYAQTPVEEELIRLLDRGGTIGGSSAGAAIQTKAMICGGTEHPEVRRGLDLFPGAIVDQHFLKRNRLPRLIDAIRDHPERVGYGIDEGTALIVDQGRLRVVGKSYVLRIRVIDKKLQIDAFKAGDELPTPGHKSSTSNRNHPPQQAEP